MNDEPDRAARHGTVVPLGRPARTSPELLARARRAQQLRTGLRALSLPPNLFVDPAWDMMVELVIADGEQLPLFVKDLILLSGESAASAMRRIARLEEEGLVRRCHDQRDHRRVLVTLSDRGHAAMAAMLARLFDTGETGGATPAEPVSFQPAAPRL